jgi:DNA-binding response OmpR family regulator
MSDHPKGTVLVVEDDRALGALIDDVLTDHGFAVSLLESAGPEAIRGAVIRLAPDCILLDGESPRGYGASWAEAAWVAGRDRAVPVIMFTGHADALREAEENTSARSRSAGFAGIVPKPFDLDHLVMTVARTIRGPSSGRE